MLFHIQHGLFRLDLTDYYALLGISLDADSKQIRQRYLNIARQLHPDTRPGEDKEDLKQATQILSKLVNPAYKVLSKEKSRNEFNSILSQMGKRQASEGGKITIASEDAKDLFKAEANLELLYNQKIEELALDQYQSLETNVLGNIIAQISELNLVYLILKEGTQLKPIKMAEENQNTQSSQPTAKQVDPVIRRAQEYLSQGNVDKAILKLREGLKVNPNHSSYHGLLGLAYLRQNQLGMAKVHINKAYASNPQDTFAIQGKSALRKATTAVADKTKGKESKKGGMFGTFFGRKKKK